jgi:DNA-binding response OmpR family regulator
MKTKHTRADGPTSAQRVLVADDDPEMRSLLAEELRDEGYEVTLAKNGLDVLSEIPFRSFDAVITDWKLPVRDGLLILRTVKEVRPDLPVVLITAYGDAKIRKKVEKTGAIYLQKPFSMEAFKGLIRSLVGGYH